LHGPFFTLSAARSPLSARGGKMTKAFFSELIKVKFRLSAKFQVLYHILLESKALTLAADEAICLKPKALFIFSQLLLRRPSTRKNGLQKMKFHFCSLF
jgi:hypothetical protein